MKLIKYIVFITILGLSSSCKDFLDLEPTNKVSADDLFSSTEGVKAYMAGLYNRLPIEDFNFTSDGGFTTISSIGTYPFIITDEASHSQNYGAGLSFPYWDIAYRLNKDINLLFDAIPGLSMSDNDKDKLLGEAYFMRAYLYYALAIRHGGVPLISRTQDVSNGYEDLYVPRSTEKETWDFVLESCDKAIQLLDDGDGSKRRTNKWVAYALKSRASLFAASVAKYWGKAPLIGVAVDNGLVGMNSSDADDYYQQCIDCSNKLMESGRYSLYKANPSSISEAAKNYRELFEDPNRAPMEAIFIKGFPQAGKGGSSQDNWGNPNQTAGSWPFPGRFNPTLDLVDSYESYSNPGVSSPIVTTVDGDVDNYEGYSSSRDYLTFDNTTDIFKDKDARLQATVILPGSIWKDTEIIIQGGIIKTDGSPFIEQNNRPENVGGVNYYPYGNSNLKLYSGFDITGGNFTRSGFLFKKFLNQNFVPSAELLQSTTDWMEFRYAEILLNYAEAVVESGQGDFAKAKTAMNATRRRAGFTTDIDLNIDNVLRERRVELAFENKRYWDLSRRREIHEIFNNINYKHSLVPVYDLTQMKYIFVRKNLTGTQPPMFFEKEYYKPIPGVEVSKLVQNPEY